MVTIIIPCRNEEQYIGKCLESIINNDYPKDDLEVLVIDGVSDDRTRDIISKYTQQYSFISLFDNLKKIVPTALNIGIQNAKGGVVIRMDAIITNLEGRVDDYLITSDGRKIGRLSTAIKRSPTIHSTQIVQDRPGHAYLLIRPGDSYQTSHATAVCDDIIERIGEFNLEIVEVPEIPKTPQGKTVLVVRLDGRPAMRETYNQIVKEGLQ